MLGLGLFAGTITVQRDIINIQNRNFINRAIRETNYISCHTMRLLKDVCSNGKGFEPEFECLYCRCLHSESKSMNYDCSIAKSSVFS